MYAQEILKGAAIGALLGGAVSGVRSFGKSKSTLPALPVKHDNIAAIDSELEILFQEYSKYANVIRDPKLKNIFMRNFQNSIIAAERELAIEMQIEQQEIVANYRDYTAAQKLALASVECLRATEQAYPDNAEMIREVREKGNQIAAQLSIHLNNIATECLPR